LVSYPSCPKNVCMAGLPDATYILRPNFWKPGNATLWYHLWPFGILCDHLLYFMAIGYIFRSFVKFPPFWYIISRKNLATLLPGIIEFAFALKIWAR
jgi:hypothetical protein